MAIKLDEILAHYFLYGKTLEILRKLRSLDIKNVNAIAHIIALDCAGTDISSSKFVQRGIRPFRCLRLAVELSRLF